MAVKPKSIDGYKPFFFLSRLCGGEGKAEFDGMMKGFLSRLCGGEVGVGNNGNYQGFLSRLCGGEV